MRPRQTLVLGLLLLLPVLAFLFLFRFGSNRYALPTYLPDRVDSTRVGGGWRRDTVFHQVAPFRLLASSGRVVGSAEVGQGMYVAQFDDGGPESQRLAQALLRVQEKFRHELRVRLVTFVLNPGPDPALTLEKRAADYGTVAGKWVLLTGAADSLNRLVLKEFRLTSDPKRLPGAVYTANLPAGRLLLVDRDRRVRGLYNGLDAREIDRLLTEITVQIYEYEHPR